MINHNEYFGLSKFCNICGYRFSKFAKFGISQREAKCPVCDSLERHRHLYVYISALFNKLEEKKILHFAPEKILKDIFKSSNSKYYDADIDNKKATYQIDITNIPYEDNFFDYIFCVHVLEHISNDIKAMEEIYRVLHPNGVAFLCVPIFKEFLEDLSVTNAEDRLHLYGQRDHVRKYDINTFKNRLKSVNFSIEISDPSKFPTFLKDACLGDYIFICRKKL